MYSRDALKFLAKLDTKAVNRIRTAVHGLTKSPPDGDIRPLRGFSDGRKRLRVGGWRVIYRFDRDGELEVLLIIDIGSRGDVYK